MEQRLAKMNPEEIIETYFSATDRKDYATAHACQVKYDVDLDMWRSPLWKRRVLHSHEKENPFHWMED